MTNQQTPSPACPLCGGKPIRQFVKDDFWLSDCARCAHRFAEIKLRLSHTAEIYDDNYFTGGGAGYDNYLSEADLLRRAGRRYGEIIKKYTAGKTGMMLDVGSAAGFVLQGFHDSGWRGIGVEPNAAMADFGRRELNLQIENASLEDFQTTEKFDLINLVQVVAHFQEPRRIFAKLTEMTQPNGFWLIETWRRDSLTARVFGENWHEYSPPSVLQWFSKTGLQNFIAEFGLTVVASGRPSKWINAAHAKSLLKFKLAQMSGGQYLAKGLAILPDKLNLPYPAEDLMWLLCRKK